MVVKYTQTQLRDISKSASPYWRGWGGGGAESEGNNRTSKQTYFIKSPIENAC